METIAVFMTLSLSILQNMIGEWQPPESLEITEPPRSNPVVGHIIHRLYNIVHPPTVSWLSALIFPLTIFFPVYWL